MSRMMMWNATEKGIPDFNMGRCLLIVKNKYKFGSNDSEFIMVETDVYEWNKRKRQGRWGAHGWDYYNDRPHLQIYYKKDVVAWCAIPTIKEVLEFL